MYCVVAIAQSAQAMRIWATIDRHASPSHSLYRDSHLVDFVKYFDWTSAVPTGLLFRFSTF
ncbi:hypothetical protein ACE1CD_03885 [Aerosakkonema sp. BLCC-F183]|uniref:hypothetical protein n=1 Tax=Aerosakkonema sp. BLCC-F183 TaxID=3342834 RepID=UPI0035BAE5AB